MGLRRIAATSEPRDAFAMTKSCGSAWGWSQTAGVACVWPVALRQRFETAPNRCGSTLVRALRFVANKLIYSIPQ
jgi:hypothetical protein